MTVRRRLALVYAVGVAATVALVAVVVWWQMALALRSGLDEALATKADAVATSLENNGQVGLQETNTSSGSFFVQLRSPAGAVVDATANAPAGVTAASGEATLGGRRYLVRVATAADGTTIVVGTDLAGVDATLRSLEGFLLAAGTAAGAISTLAGWYLSGRALLPLRRLARDAARIGPAGLSSRLSRPPQADEVAQLADTLNAMLDRIDELVARQRRFVATASHELRTPLSALRVELDLADDPVSTREELLEAIHAAQGQAVRLTELSSSLLGLASVAADGRSLAISEFGVDALAEGVARSVRVLAREHGVEVRVRTDASTVASDRVRLELALGNVVRNAIVHGGSGGVVEVDCRTVPAEPVPLLRAEVSDRGPGFGLADPAALFEPFARGATRASGSGLGLATVAEAIGALHGIAGASGRPGGGATVWFTVPAAA